MKYLIATFVVLTFTLAATPSSAISCYPAPEDRGCEAEIPSLQPKKSPAEREIENIADKASSVMSFCPAVEKGSLDLQLKKVVEGLTPAEKTKLAKKIAAARKAVNAIPNTCSPSAGPL